MNTSVLCEQGQITIPKSFRSKLGFASRMFLTIRISGDALVVEKASPKRNPFESARGCCSFPKGIASTDELIREMRGTR